ELEGIEETTRIVIHDARAIVREALVPRGERGRRAVAHHTARIVVGLLRIRPDHVVRQAVPRRTGNVVAGLATAEQNVVRIGENVPALRAPHANLRAVADPFVLLIFAADRDMAAATGEARAAHQGRVIALAVAAE